MTTHKKLIPDKTHPNQFMTMGVGLGTSMPGVVGGSGGGTYKGLTPTKEYKEVIGTLVDRLITYIPKFVHFKMLTPTEAYTMKQDLRDLFSDNLNDIPKAKKLLKQGYQPYLKEYEDLRKERIHQQESKGSSIKEKLSGPIIKEGETDTMWFLLQWRRSDWRKRLNWVPQAQDNIFEVSIINEVEAYIRVKIHTDASTLGPTPLSIKGFEHQRYITPSTLATVAHTIGPIYMDEHKPYPTLGMVSPDGLDSKNTWSK